MPGTRHQIIELYGCFISFNNSLLSNFIVKHFLQGCGNSIKSARNISFKRKRRFRITNIFDRQFEENLIADAGIL